jgi:dienelactone hydrolase
MFAAKNALAALAALALGGSVAAQSAPERSAFLILKGNDTLAVERVTRRSSNVEGDIAVAGQARVTYAASLSDSLQVTDFTFRAYGAGAPADAAPLQTGSLQIGSDSVLIIVNRQGQETRLARPAHGHPLPLVNNDFEMVNVAIARAHLMKSTKFTQPMFALSGGVALDATVEFIGSDSVLFTVAGQPTRFAIDAAGRITGGWMPNQGLTIVHVSGAAASKISLGRTDYSAPADAPYRSEEVTVQTKAGHVLTGTLTLPKNAKGKVPVVVTITGSGLQDRDEYISLVSGYRPFRQVADTLGRRGIAVLRLDDRGINGSGGDVSKATTVDFADDIRAGVAFARSRPELDGARVALLGHSEGGVIAPMVAATDPRIAAIVLMAGTAYTGNKIIEFQLRNEVMGDSAIPAAKKDSALKAQHAEYDSTAAKLPWMQYFLTYDPLPALRKVKAPVLILQGATDQQVTPDQAPVLESTLKASGNKNVTMIVFAAHDHLFLVDSVGFPGNYGKLPSGKIGPEVMGVIADWLVKELRP